MGVGVCVMNVFVIVCMPRAVDRERGVVGCIFTASVCTHAGRTVAKRLGARRQSAWARGGGALGHAVA